MASTAPGSGTARRTDRLEAFSDAVLAIAITLPVVELHAPMVRPGGDLAAGYAELHAGYLAYALSFTVIGLYWAHSHFSGKIVKKTDHVFNLLTLLFLALVSITPFPSRPLAEHLNDAANLHTAAAVYAALLAAPAAAWLLRWWYAITHDLLDERLDPAYLRRLTRKYIWTALLLVLGAALCLWGQSWPGLALSGLITLGYLLPPMTPEYLPGQEPENELEDPDDHIVGPEMK